MNKIYIFAILYFILTGCSDKDSYEQVYNTPLTIVTFTVTDKDGSDLLDKNNPKCILNPDYFTSKTKPSSDEYKFFVNVEYKYYDYVVISGDKYFKGKGPYLSSLTMINGKYALTFVDTDCLKTNLEYYNRTFEFYWKDGIEPDIFDFQFYELPNGKEYATINDETIEKVGRYQFHYNILK